MANQRHPDKKLVGAYIHETDKEALSQNAKSHGVHVSDIVKTTTSDYMRLNKSQQRRRLNSWESRCKGIK